MIRILSTVAFLVFATASGLFANSPWQIINPGITGVNGYVYATAYDASGNLYVGGKFTLAGNVPARNIAKWNGTRWESLGQGVQGEVNDILIGKDGSIYVGGDSINADWLPHIMFSKWDGSQWKSLVDSTARGRVSKMALSPSGDSIALCGGIAANYAAIWTKDNVTALPGLSVNGSGGITGIAFDAAGALWAVGELNTTDQYGQDGIAFKWNGSTWESMDDVHEGRAQSIVKAPDGSLWVSGNMWTIDSRESHPILKYKNSQWSVSSEAENYLDLCFDSSNRPNVGGEFAAIGSSGAYWARQEGSAWSSPGGSPNSDAYTIACGPQGQVALGGAFLYMKTATTNSTVNFVSTLENGAWKSLGDGIPSQVNALQRDPTGKLLYAGTLVQNGITHYGVFRQENSGWQQLGDEFSSNSFSALAVDSKGAVYTSGEFRKIGADSIARIAKWDGVQWKALGNGLNNAAQGLLVDSKDQLVAVGAFTRSGQDMLKYVALWNGVQWTELGKDLDKAVNAVELYQEKITIGGQFTLAGETPLNYIAQWSGSSWQPIGDGLDSAVITLSVQGDQLYSGGHKGINHWNGTAWSRLGTLLQYESILDMVAHPNGNLYVTGFITKISGQKFNQIAYWDGKSWNAVGEGLLNGHSGGALLALNNTTLAVGGRFSGGGALISPNLAAFTVPAGNPSGLHALPAVSRTILNDPRFDLLGRLRSDVQKK